jgi:Lon protease-like protein
MDPQSESPENREMVVALFPLPNVILFPGAVLPLHIFEERYKTMTADALAGDRLIAMALLRPGWEKDYHLRPAIEPIVCIGTIARWEQLEDGTYNFLLHGKTRARILGEKDSSPYRVAHLEPLRENPAPEDQLADMRRKLMDMFASEPLASQPLTEQLNKIINSSMPTGVVADLIAFHALNAIALKQSLLAETDVAKRVARVISALAAALPVMEVASRGISASGNYN